MKKRWIKAIKVVQVGDVVKGGNTHFTAREANPYYEWYKNNNFFRCKEIDLLVTSRGN